MKKTLLTLAILSTASAAYADEGMWMPQQLPQVAKQLKAAGLKLDPATLTKLTEFPMGAIVSLGGCSASFVSPEGLVITNHHCVYNSVAVNSTKENDLLTNGFLAKSFAEELPAAPGSRIFVTKDVSNVSSKVISPEVAKLSGKARIDAMEKNEKSIVAECEKDPGHRCTVASYYGGLEFYLIKQLEIRDVRLVHAPPSGVGKFGGDTDNWMWPRHTGDYGFYRAYVSKDGKAADYSKDNVPYVPKHYLKIAKDGVKEGDFIMVAGYPGRTNRHRLPSEVAYTFDQNYPAFIKTSGETLAVIDTVEKLIAERDAQTMRDWYLMSSSPRLLSSARSLYRLSNEMAKPDADRRAGFQERDLPRFKASVAGLDRTYDPKVDKALVMNSLLKYAAQPAAQRSANFDAAMGIKDGMTEAQLSSLLDAMYSKTTLNDAKTRAAWLTKKPADFQASNDPFIQAAVAMYDGSLKKEAEDEELAGKIQQSYANYMKAKIAYMNSKGQAVYPDANSTLRVTFGKIMGRDHGADGTGSWTAFTTVKGVQAKATGEGEFNAPVAQLTAIKNKDFGKYVDPKLKTVPVNYLATLDITGGNSGSAALNAKGELIGLAFDGTLDSIISDWDFNKANTRDIQVDVRYILWNMKHVDHADNLLKEMNAL